MTTTPPLAPAISIAIPMYNVEKYIGACLESILAQTFQDFEVVVVDNGSTDNSPAILESYIPKFGGRLKTFRIEKNSGSPAPAYNNAVALSRGKYVYVMDSDDLLVNNALEILYNYAEKSNADVIHMDNYWEFSSDNNKILPSQQEVTIFSPPNAVKQPMWMIENKFERLKKVCGGFYTWPAWHKFLKRDFLIENDITFFDLKASSDVGWTIQVVCSAEKLLRIPNPLYVYRMLSSSLSHKKRTTEVNVNFWLDMLVNGINSFDNWMKKQNFFQDNPQFKWLIFETIANDAINHMSGYIFSIPNIEYCKLVESKLKKIFGESASMLTYCFISSVFSKLRCNMLLQNLNQLNNTIKTLQANQQKGG